MDWFQVEIELPAFKRGFHLITGEIINNIPGMNKIKLGIAHIFIKHTSASLTINENYDPDVRKDFESHFNNTVKENAPYYVHTVEGSDDMPAHLKATIIGSSVTVPVTNGRLNLGTWQGIYLCEHRNHGGRRKIVITVSSE